MFCYFSGRDLYLCIFLKKMYMNRRLMKLDGSDFIIPVCSEQQQVFKYMEFTIIYLYMYIF